MKKVFFFGLGRIGLPTALLAASSQYKVIGYDLNYKIIDNLKKKIIHFEEPKLNELLISKIKKNFIKFSNNITESDIYIIAVPTPIKSDKSPDLSHVMNCVDKIINFIKPQDLIILESTVPIGTLSLIKKKILQKKPLLNEKLYLSYCPERVLPGNAVNEIKRNTRIIGGINTKSTNFSIKFYKSFLNVKFIKTNDKTAEMIKLSENAFRDVNIAFANELSRIADSFDISVSKVISSANYHPRVSILNSGLGVGGHCIPIDPFFLINSYKPKNSIIRNARVINDTQPKYVLNKIIKYIKKNKIDIGITKIGILGITYKENNDDIRESPAINFLQILAKYKFKNIFFHDPYITSIKNINVKAKSLNFLLSKSDVIIKLVNHDNYINIDLNSFKKNIKIFDVKNAFK